MAGKHFTQTLRLAFLATSVGLLGGLAGGCDDDTGDEPTDDAALDEALQSYCEDTGECGDGKHDLTTTFLATKALWVLTTDWVKNNISYETVEANCVMPGRFEHFVDYAADVDGEPQFTSVQDFTIRNPKLTPEEVLAEFHDDWLIWWDNGGTDRDTVGADGPGVWHQEIRPLGISAVAIVMDVYETEAHPEHPKLRNEDRDLSEGFKQDWDAGIRIEMSPGNSFDGTMYVLARRTDEGIAVREIWHDTKPISPLVTKVVPKVFRLTREQALAIPPALHIISLQGCSPLPRGTGYPGLIERLEAR